MDSTKDLLTGRRGVKKPEKLPTLFMDGCWGCLATTNFMPYCLALANFGRSVKPIQIRVADYVHNYLAPAAPKS